MPEIFWVGMVIGFIFGFATAVTIVNQIEKHYERSNALKRKGA